MALKLDVASDKKQNTEKVELKNAYTKIYEIRYQTDRVIISLYTYRSKAVRTANGKELFTENIIIPLVNYDITNYDNTKSIDDANKTKAYNHIKSLPEFTTAVDI